MQNVRCANGHFFDPVKHNFCPHCGVKVDGGGNGGMQQTMPQPQAGIPLVSPRPVASPIASDEGKTVGMYRKKLGIDPVVGWLVCISGADKGKDYRLRTERNFIGRGESMDVRISGDESISRENHAIVSYNPKKSLFRVFPGEGRGIVYLNNEEIIAAEELKAGDVIEIGQTKLMFVPFCGAQFQWDSES
ncbi:FHA domain-containing protein [Cohnella yongneupensis]|uniref:FHA domain-containing protein n=1 Tax=Cohnella yongneupensis TaxID=425006 RepID=A0ABW0R9K2_9BACL